REHATSHQFRDHVLGFDIELFGEFLDGDALGQCDAAMLARGFNLRLRPDERGFQPLLGLTFIPLGAVHFVSLSGATPLLVRCGRWRRRNQRRTSKRRTASRSCRSGTSPLHSRRCWPLTTWHPGPHSRTRTIRRTALLLTLWR